MRLHALWTSTSLALGACSSPCDYTAAGEICGRRAVTVPIVGQLGWPVIEAELRGQTVQLLVDTGAAALVLSAQLLGVQDKTWHRVDKLCIDELCFEQALAWAEDNQIVQASAGERQVQGLLGMSLLRHAVLELDRGERLRLDFEREACAGRAIALTFDRSGRPFAAVSVDGTRLGEVLLDSGALYTVLSEQTLLGLDRYLRDGATSASACDVHGCNDSAFLGQLRELCVGELCEAQVEVKFPVWDAVGTSFFARARYAWASAANQLIFCDPG